MALARSVIMTSTPSLIVACILTYVCKFVQRLRAEKHRRLPFTSAPMISHQSWTEDFSWSVGNVLYFPKSAWFINGKPGQPHSIHYDSGIMRSGKQIFRVLCRMKKEAVIVYSLCKNGVCICWHAGKSPVPHIVGYLESVLWGQTLTDQILHHGIAVTECQRCGQIQCTRMANAHMHNAIQRDKSGKR